MWRWRWRSRAETDERLDGRAAGPLGPWALLSPLLSAGERKGDRSSDPMMGDRTGQIRGEIRGDGGGEGGGEGGRARKEGGRRTRAMKTRETRSINIKSYFFLKDDACCLTLSSAVLTRLEVTSIAAASQISNTMKILRHELG